MVRKRSLSGRAVEAVAMFGAVQATFSDVHPFADLIVQRNGDAVAKGSRGAAGRKACARHVASYSVAQLAAAAAVTRACGWRVPAVALLAGTAVNAVTHYAIDRRQPLIRFLRSRVGGKAGFLDHATVTRRIGADGQAVVDASGPGTAMYECDQAMHRVIGVAASVVTTAIAVRWRRD